MARKTKDEDGEPGGPKRYQADLTALEIEEGRTFLLRCAQPNNSRAAHAHAQALGRMSRAKGCRWGTQRCLQCGCYLHGRRPSELCRNPNCNAIVPAIPLPPLHTPPKPKKTPTYPARPWTPKPLPASIDPTMIYRGDEPPLYT